MWGLKKLAISSLPSRAHSFASWPTTGRIGAEVDDRRRDVLPLAVGDHLGPAVRVAIGHRRVGRSQVDSDEGGPLPQATSSSRITTHSTTAVPSTVRRLPRRS